MGLFGAPQRATILCPDLYLDGFPLDGLILDVSIAERHTIERQVTQFPIEYGGDISDHIHHTPRRVELQAFLTDTPDGLIEAATEAARNIQTSITQTLGQPVNGPLASTRSKDLFAVLELLTTRPAVCTVITDLYVYEQMVALSLGVPRSAADGRGLMVDLVFQRVVAVRTSTRAALVVEEPAPSTNPPPQPTLDVGKATAAPVDTRTGFARALDFLGGLL